MSERAGYSGLQIGFHWAIAVLVVFNYLWSDGMGEALRARLAGAGGSGGEVHVWVGVAILVLTVLRLALRMARGAPPPPGEPGTWPVRAAAWGHGLLYLLMIGVPAGGAVAWFGGIASLGDAHAVAANLLMAVAAAHAALALFHHYVLKDGVLVRMVRPE